MKGAGLLGLVAALAVAAWWWKREADVQTLVDKLNDALPARLAQWAPQLARSAMKTCPLGVDVLKWALFLAGVMARESEGGTQLRPRGAAGAGDWTARAGHWLDDAADVGVVVQALPSGWLAPSAPPPYIIPSDGRGWGRGLMQLDLVEHPELLNAQTEAASNIDAGALELRRLFLLTSSDMDPRERLQRTADGYNAGERALTHPSPDSITTGHNYGSDVLARAAGFEQELPA